MTELISTQAALRARLGTGPVSDASPVTRRPCVVVMTMGALHEGHAELVRAARDWLGNRGLGPRDADIVVTVFVNPLQFTSARDLESYPRTLDDDLAVCRAEGVDVVFAPTVAEMYPDGDPVVTVDPGALGELLEGVHRPGHLRGMLTVVNRLLMLTLPAAAMFGEKDFQQLALVRQMAGDLLIPVEIVGVPTVREDDGLAMSSRNARLGRAARTQAVAVVGSLRRTQALIDAGTDPDAAAAEAAAWLAAQDGVESVDYLVVRDPGLLEPARSPEARALVAAVVGGVRLIDNERVTIPGAL